MRHLQFFPVAPITTIGTYNWIKLSYTKNYNLHLKKTALIYQINVTRTKSYPTNKRGMGNQWVVKHNGPLKEEKCKNSWNSLDIYNG